MKFSNPRPPEGINSGGYRPGREFFVLTGALLSLCALILVVVFQFSQWVAPLVPFSWERQVERQFVEALVGENAIEGPVQRKLQQLADRLVGVMALDDEITIQVHYVDDPAVNAVATLGGNIVVFRGLLERLPSEDALAMVLAHEIAHVKNRDVLAAMGSGVIVTVASSVLLGDMGAVSDVVGQETILTMLRFSRTKEAQADKDAFRAIVSLYGHGGGAKDLFDVFSAVEHETGSARKTDLMTSHPLTGGRLETLQEIARANGWAADGPRTNFSAK